MAETATAAATAATSAATTAAVLAPSAAYNDQYITIAVDGACTGNGRADARAAAAAVVLDVDGQSLAVRGARAERLSGVATNNRAEWRAIIIGLECARELVAAGADPSDVEVVSDSRNCVLTLTTWLGARVLQNKHTEMANYDLIEVAAKLYKDTPIVLNHSRGHKRNYPRTNPAFARWYGNFIADKIATRYIAAEAGPAAAVGADILAACRLEVAHAYAKGVAIDDAAPAVAPRPVGRRH